MPNSGPAGFRNPEFFGYATITFFLCLNYYFIVILFYRSTLIVCWFTCLLHFVYSSRIDDFMLHSYIFVSYVFNAKQCVNECSM
jgi:hypothetical protein